MIKSRFLLLVVFYLPLVSCTDEETYITNIGSTDVVRIRGVVKAWRCGVGDIFNNPYGGYYFSAETEEPAKVTLIRDNGFSSWVETDDSSSFRMVLSEGAHIAIVETGYTRPDTFYNLQLWAGDTNLVLDITFDILDPELLDFNFFYKNPSDTLGMNKEWEIVWDVNREVAVAGMPYPLDIWGYTDPDTLRSMHQFHSGAVSVNYTIRIRRYHYNVHCYHILDVLDSIGNLIDTDTTGRFEYLSCYSHYAYICLDAATDTLSMN
jgi:hypothetical protein